MGIMVTYDGGWSGLDYWKGRDGALRDTYSSWIYDNLSSEAAAKALDALVGYKTDKARAAFAAMGKAVISGLDQAMRAIMPHREAGKIPLGTVGLSLYIKNL